MSDSDWMQKPALYVVATPIGNLGDLTERAKQVLDRCDLIAAEDTRQTRKLLSHLGLSSPELVAYHDHNEKKLAPLLIRRVQDEGLAMVLVSDAGTPAIADPGYRLVAEAHACGLPVHPIPGASAMTALVSCSGLPSDRVLFVGFLPTKTQSLKKEVAGWRDLRASIVFYETPRRLQKSLATIAESYPRARLVIGRELTKLHEEIVNLPAAEWETWLSETTLKGEVVAMLHLGDADLVDVESLRPEAEEKFRQGMTLSDLVRYYKEAGFKRSAVYPMLLAAKASIEEESEP